MYKDYFEKDEYIFEIVCDDSFLLKLKTAEKKGKINPNFLTDKVKIELVEYFAGKREKFDIPIFLNGTDFQNKVWNELLNIPFGETRSYIDIAKAIGNEKASRAVGNANNKNPIWIIVPCHRVIGKNGKLVGYGGGIKLKEKLLETEKLGRA